MKIKKHRQEQRNNYYNYKWYTCSECMSMRCCSFQSWNLGESTKWKGKWKETWVHGFSVGCYRNCTHDIFNSNTHACINCFKKSFGKAPENKFENSSKQNDSETFQTAESYLEEVPMHDPVEVDRNVTKN